MDDFAIDALTAVQAVTMDIYTSAYRVSGTVQSRFSRVAELLNQLTATHMPVDHATVSEFADPTATVSALQALVALDQVVVAVAPELAGDSRPDMKISKRAVRAQLVIPPFRLTGTVHVVMGSRPVDGLLNLRDAFVTMTDATITSGQFPELGREVDALAVRRESAHIVLVADDERPDELLADVLDEATAESWLHRADQPARTDS